MRAAGWVTFFWLVGGEIAGQCSRTLNHEHSGFRQSGVSPCSCYHLHEGHISSFRSTQRWGYIYPFGRSQDPAPKLHSCFWTDSPLLLHPLLPLISKCLNLPFGTQGRSRRLNKAYFLQIRNRGHRKDMYPEGTHSVLLAFTMMTWNQGGHFQRFNLKDSGPAIHVASICPYDRANLLSNRRCWK